ncbi:hypothetical protein WDV93_25785 [Pantoea ananatis]
MPIYQSIIPYSGLRNVVKKIFTTGFVVPVNSFLISISVSIWLLARSNASLNAVNKEIRVVLSVIDPINHSRTLRVRLMEYMKEIENDGPQGGYSLDSVKSVAAKADAAFQAYPECATHSR